jgi:hypothetical protein
LRRLPSAPRPGLNHDDAATKPCDDALGEAFESRPPASQRSRGSPPPSPSRSSVLSGRPVALSTAHSCPCGLPFAGSIPSVRELESLKAPVALAAAACVAPLSAQTGAKRFAWDDEEP